MLRKVWVSTPKWTCKVTVDGTRIVEAAPLLRKFVGQSIGALSRWAHKRFGEVEVRRLEDAA